MAFEVSAPPLSLRRTLFGWSAAKVVMVDQ